MAKEFFKSLPDTSTPINASRLNGLLDGEEAMGNIIVDGIKTTNMINIDTLKKGFVDTSGGITESFGTYKGEMYSEFIKVKPNTNYIFKIFETSDTNESWFGVGEYSSNSFSTFIRRDTETNITSNNISFTTSATTNYIIVSSRNLTNASKIMLVEGTEIGNYNENIYFGSLSNIIGSLITTKRVTRQQVSFPQGLNTLTFDMTNLGYALIGIVCIDNSNDSSWEPYIQKYSINGNNAYITFVNTSASTRTFNVTVTGLYLKTPSVATTSEASVMSISEE